MTEKGENSSIQLYELRSAKLEKATKFENLLTDSESPSVLKHERAFLESRTEIMPATLAFGRLESVFGERGRGGTTRRNREIDTLERENSDTQRKIARGFF